MPSGSLGSSTEELSAQGEKTVTSPTSEEGPITVFAILDFIFAALCFMWVGFMSMGVTYGVVGSSDQGEDLMASVLGCLLLASPCLIGLLVYSLAGLGLFKRRPWGYYAHIVGGFLAIFSCIGIVYTVFVLIYAFKPEFKAAFFAAEPTRVFQSDADDNAYNRDDGASRRHPDW